MIDIKLIRENPEIVKENMRKKFKEDRIPMVDEVLVLDENFRQIQQDVDGLRNKRNVKSTEIGNLMQQKKQKEAQTIKEEVNEINDDLLRSEKNLEDIKAKITNIMLKIPNIIEDTVPLRQR